MNYSFIPLLFILLPLAIIIIVIVRRFPQLALLDVDSLPQVREEKKKNEMIKRRVEERAARAKKEWFNKLKPTVKLLRRIQLEFRQYVGKVERQLAEERRRKFIERLKPVSFNKKREISKLLQEAMQAKEDGNFDAGEKKYLTAIKLDPKSAATYRGLGDIYAAQEQWAEAKETYRFVLQLDPHDDLTLLRLAEIAEQAGDIKAAVGYYERAVLIGDHDPQRFAKFAELLSGIGQYDAALAGIEQAVELEPQNPRYLDMMTEISILGGQKAAAESAYQQLRMVNPDNAKLAGLKDRINKMSVPTAPT